MKQFKEGDIISFPSAEEMGATYVRTVVEDYPDRKITKDVCKINCLVNGQVETLEIAGNLKVQFK
jgi:hypothetical protein